MATSLKRIEAQIAKLKERQQKIIENNKKSAVRQIQELMARAGLTFEDLGVKEAVKLSGTSRKKGKPALPLYRDPVSGKTWSGRGRQPEWVQKAENLDAIRIPESERAALAAQKIAKNTGKQPPMYRDPETGKTWSGRGPAPQWLAGQEDRSQFLVKAAA